MCGIVGVVAYGKLDAGAEKARQEAMIFLTTELLQLTQPRGDKATGIATLFDSCDYIGLKMGTAAQEFVSRFGGKETDFEGYLNIWRGHEANARMAIGHCRKPSAYTQATALDNKNNHPIKVGNIIGVHNGTLTNHETIFKNLKCERDGKVDSEAIFRLLNHYTSNDAEPFTKEAIQETCKRLEGSYACLAFNGNNPYQMAAFRDSRPLELCVVKPLKLVLLTSERIFLKEALFRYSMMAKLYAPNKFIDIGKDSLTLQTLTDDSLYIFNTQTNITENTKPEDLYITERIPRGNKIWKSAAFGNTTKHQSYHNANTNNATTNKASEKKGSGTNTSISVHGKAKSTEVDVMNKKSDRKKDKYKSIGMAWSDKIGGFVDISDTESHGNVEIDLDNDIVIDAIRNVEIGNTSEKSKDSIDLTESDVPIDTLIAEHAKIEVINVENKDFINKTKTASQKILPPPKKEDGPITGDIDLGSYPDAIEKATLATRRELNFSSNDELANSLEISGVETMKAMSLYSLANRIKKYFFQKGWQLGYVTKCKENEGFGNSDDALLRNMIIRARDKANKATDRIRVLKNIVRIYETLFSGHVEAKKVKSVVDEFVRSGAELNSNVIQGVFHQSDLKHLPMLSQVNTVLDGKDNSTGG